MRLTDRLQQYLAFKGITAYRFERSCAIANGYLQKQSRGKGSIGSDILEKIHRKYADLNLVWLLTGTGSMTVPLEGESLEEDKGSYLTFRDEMIALLRRQVAVLETSIADKDKIISLLESRTGKPSGPKAGNPKKEDLPKAVKPPGVKPQSGKLPG